MGQLRSEDAVIPAATIAVVAPALAPHLLALEEVAILLRASVTLVLQCREGVVEAALHVHTDPEHAAGDPRESCPVDFRQAAVTFGQDRRHAVAPALRLGHLLVLACLLHVDMHQCVQLGQLGHTVPPHRIASVRRSRARVDRDELGRDRLKLEPLGLLLDLFLSVTLGQERLLLLLLLLRFLPRGCCFALPALLSALAGGQRRARRRALA